MNKNNFRFLLFVIFALSGFTGLIYESIWTHYLKLVLGHAAYSQTLVLLLFMGGMALGAWIVSRISSLITRPIMVYAVIELIIGVMALLFHNGFLLSQDILFDLVLPAIGSAGSAEIIRWVWASILILPQSILLGATFPLMSAGIIRFFPKQSGSILATLYFSNSIGAAIGVLVSGFVLIDRVGLPGTIMTGGLINILIALIVWGSAKTQSAQKPVQTDHAIAQGALSPELRLLLLASFLTGLASFFYEIAWIRMLNLVLGTTTQSFELMLSSFIFGIAFGGLWIRKRIDKITNVLKFSGYVQIIMGLLAASTIVLYNSTFDLMAEIMSALQRNESGYNLFMASSHLLAFIVMAPTTFMAGMTLPLFTYCYMKNGYGERGIGRIYSANTIGSIIGIIFAVHWIMPHLGLKNLIALGSLVDILLGFVLIYVGIQKRWSVQLISIMSATAMLFVGINLLIEFDKGKMASGLYRFGRLDTSSENILYQQDGKTASIVIEAVNSDSHEKYLFLRTNGKPDAKVIFDQQKHSLDEYTMALLATFPLATHPEAQTAAVIGMGSGISSNTLLLTDRLKTLDTIEIEPAVIEAAKFFGVFSERVFSDPRSNIIIDDAKSYFSINEKKYDLIISEPSNPWVSGVANLFTQEFYHQIKKHLNPGGVLTQWLQVYEINPKLMSTVFKALNREFKYYVAYQTKGPDMIIVASNEDNLSRLDSWIFTQPDLAAYLEHLDIQNIDDLYARRIGDQNILNHIFETVYRNVHPNSDFYPVLSRHAPKAMFLKQDGRQLLNLPYLNPGIMDFLNPLPEGASRSNLTPTREYEPARLQQISLMMHDWVVNGKTLDPQIYEDGNNYRISDLEMFISYCHLKPALGETFAHYALLINNYLPEQKAVEFWKAIESNNCFTKLDTKESALIRIYRAQAARDSAMIIDVAKEIIARIETAQYKPYQYDYFHTTLLLALIHQGRVEEAQELSQKIKITSSTTMQNLLLLAIADPDRFK